jgi:hypothetical protein
MLKHICALLSLLVAAPVLAQAANPAITAAAAEPSADDARAGLAIAQQQAVPLHVLPLEGQDFALAAAGKQ